MSGCGHIVCGELHYPRIPREYWRHRLQLARAMGLNAVSTYVFWNVHEETEGTYRFDGWRDVATFVRIAAEEELRVVLRPGPYVCAEWEFGGLPAWLLRDGPVALRSREPAFMDPARRWLMRLGHELANVRDVILAVQLENEYGAFGDDKHYLAELRDALNESGFAGLPYYTIDQPGDRERGRLDDLPSALTFAPAQCPAVPLICGEYWAGWFDHWGEVRTSIDAQAEAQDVSFMMRNRVAFNIYMLHGGSNFGLWNGANTTGDGSYQPTVTSYDYQAAIDEAGRPTEKYFRLRDRILTSADAPPVPESPPLRAVAPFACAERWPLDAALRECATSEEPLTMERLGISRGFVSYRHTVSRSAAGALECDVRDYALVRINGGTVCVIDRRFAFDPPNVELHRGDTLELLVENMGRVNYGPALGDQRKGLIGMPAINRQELRDWTMRALTAAEPQLDTPAPPDAVDAPCFYRGTFELNEAADTFFDMGDFVKGVLWINGRCAGRYWEIGPQQDLYVPAPWLCKGKNSAVVLDLFPAPGTRHLQGRMERAWSLGARRRAPSSMRPLKPNAAGANAPGCL